MEYHPTIERGEEPENSTLSHTSLSVCHVSLHDGIYMKRPEGKTRARARKCLVPRAGEMGP